MTVVQLVLLLLAYYLTFALMLVGAGLMIGGPAWAGATARFFFVRPLQLIIASLLTTLMWLLAKTWDALRGTLSSTWHVMRDYLLWPIARSTVAVLRLAAVGFADTMHFLFSGRVR